MVASVSLSEPLTPVWSASPSELASLDLSHALSPSWRMLLLNDGFTTRNLQLICNSAITATILSSEPATQVPPLAQTLRSPLLNRQVLLTNADGDPLMVGLSWWNQTQSHHYLDERPLGTRLQQQQRELFRSIQGLYLGHSDRMAALLQAPGPFWGRHYLLWSEQQPLTLIYEIFSPLLERYIGKP